MEQSLHWNWFETQETKHSIEKKVNLVFKHLIFCSIFYALNVTITMSLKLKKEFEISFNLQDLIDDDFVVAKRIIIACI